MCSNSTFVLFVGSDWVDASDATAVAEAELLSAANSIEAAARKLASLQPRLRPKVIRSNITLERLPFIAPDLLSMQKKYQIYHKCVHMHVYKQSYCRIVMADLLSSSYNNNNNNFAVTFYGTFT